MKKAFKVLAIIGGIALVSGAVKSVYDGIKQRKEDEEEDFDLSMYEDDDYMERFRNYREEQVVAKDLKDIQFLKGKDLYKEDNTDDMEKFKGENISESDYETFNAKAAEEFMRDKGMTPEEEEEAQRKFMREQKKPTIFKRFKAE